jgi:hypothetical protein
VTGKVGNKKWRWVRDGFGGSERGQIRNQKPEIRMNDESPKPKWSKLQAIISEP